ncbi:MAG: 30S ribosomal protein S12 methylthiotransferase RimO [Eubacterium sp.]|nr:30S ribosomal protein S12 methylthiotransferase RimO [Eubacterium sp.]
MSLSCYFASLGCDKNLVDTEKMMALLQGDGYIFTDDAEEADVIIVNTCAFILDAKEESIETILELAEYKKSGKCRALIAAGCLAQRYADEIKNEIPEIDAIIGTSGYDDILQAVNAAIEGECPKVLKDLAYLPHNLTKRVVTGSGAVSYLKIAEGCDKHCTYCIIPKLRGPYRSTPMEELVEEAENLAKSGTKELILVAQETTVYGKDIYGKKALPDLLHKLCKIDGIEWIRIMYCYPEEITKELLEAMKTEPKVCHYLDLPIQHCDDEILKKMGRRTDENDIREKINLIREILPDASLRTTLISGFPGETEQAHEKLKNFIKEIKFDRLGVFPYSEEEGTPAAEFEGLLDEDTKNSRAEEIMLLQKDIIKKENEKYIGRTLSVFTEGYLPEDGCYIGRSFRDAPDIDGYVFFGSDNNLMTGDMVRVLIEKANDYDLVGKETH